MIIEFTGVPGAGKSTLVPAVKDIVEEHGLIALSRWEAEQRCARRTRIGHAVGWIVVACGGVWLRGVLYPAMTLSVLRFTVRNPRFVWHVVLSQWRHPACRSGRLKRLRGFFGMAARYELFRNHLEPSEVVVLDEGLAHQAVNLYVSEIDPPNAEFIFRYLSLLPSPDWVIEIRAQLNGCLQRMSVRGMPNRLHGKSEEEVERFLAHAASVLESVSRKLAERGNRLTAVDNIGPLDQCRAGLRRGLEGILRTCARAQLWFLCFIYGDPLSQPFWEIFLL